MKILDELNAAQRAAVEYNSGPHIVVAGAGSGKTRVLTYKIAYILETGADPESILALTFTNKAANEMKTRISEMIGDKADKIWMGTFHSIFARILRMEAKKLNYKPQFSIYDAEDSSSLVGNIIQEFNFSFDSLTPNGIHRRISYLKNHLISPIEFEKHFAKTAQEKRFSTIYSEYNNRLVLNNSMDFDDLLLKPIELFNNQARVLQKYKKQFNYILVDEFQDTNRAQYEIIKQLSGMKGNVSVVGDDAQSIYSWRGAEIKNMLDFEKEFAKTKIFRLEQNYRSTKLILQASDSVLKKNQDQIKKTLWTENEEGDKIVLIRCSDEKDEALQISALIKNEVVNKKVALNEIAILYRVNSQSRALEEGLRKHKIPYKILAGLEFYKRKEVKDILAYLKILINQEDEESLLRVMNFPQRGIGNTSITKMIAFSRKLNITLFETMGRVFEVIEVKERIQKNVKFFKQLLDKYIDLKDKLSASELVRALVDELGILRMYRDENSEDSLSRLENVEELLQAIQDFFLENSEANLEDYLSEVTLFTGVDRYNENQNSVTLMTIHASKGLEFPVVFISGAEEDIFPLSPKFDAESRIEEERRLFYVAMTRAMKRVFISYARSRYRFGEVAYQNRSRFIDEMDPSTYIELNGGGSRRAGKKPVPVVDMGGIDFDYDDDNEKRSLRVGSRVYHEIFGNGKILQINSSGDQQRLVVAFEEFGQKNLMTKFANLKLI